MLLAALVAISAAGLGHGRPAASAQSLPPLAPELLPPGPLPGKPVKGDFRGAGLAQAPDVRELVSTGAGPRRVALLIARSKSDQLCLAARVGARTRKASFRCQQRWDRAPLLLRIGIGGKARDLTDFLALVGLVRQEVGRVTIESQRGSIKAPRLRSFQGFAWKAFAITPGRRGDRASSVSAEDGSRLVIQTVDLGWVYGSPCTDRHSPTVVVGEKTPNRCKGRRRLRSWSDDRDPTLGGQSPKVKAALSKSLAVDHPAVRGLIEGQAFSIDPLILWSKCNGGTIGAIVLIRLTKPVSFEGDVPFRGSDRNSGTAYVEGIAHVKAQGMLSLWVAVDNKRKAVVGIEFQPADFPGDEVNRPTIETTIVQPPKPAGGRDRKCPKTRD